MEKSAAVRMIKKVFQQADPGVLQKLYREFKDSTVLKQDDITFLWYGIKDVSRCDSEQIQALAEALSSARPEITETKERFYETLSPSVAYETQSYLKLFAEAELYYNCDVAEFDRSQLKSAIEEQQMYNKASIRRCILALRRHCAWRKKNGYPVNTMWTSNPFSADEVDIAPGLRAKCCGSPEELYQHLNHKIPLYDGYLAPVAAVLSWVGFQVSDMVDIRNEEVSDDGSSVRDIEVPECLRQILSSYKQVEEVERVSGPGGSRVLIAENIGYFLKRQSDIPTGKRLERFAISNAAQLADIFSPKDIRMSGMYYRMYLREMDREKGPVTIKEIAEIFKIGATNMSALVRDRLSEFMRYKDVFHYE